MVNVLPLAQFVNSKDAGIMAGQGYDFIVEIVRPPKV
jgi:hypothetical protein